MYQRWLTCVNESLKALTLDTNTCMFPEFQRLVFNGVRCSQNMEYSMGNCKLPIFVFLFVEIVNGYLTNEEAVAAST